MLPLTTIVYRLLWASLLGALIGIERNVRKRPAGMRTGVCIGLGVALFTILSVEIAKLAGDTSSTRIASNIVQGIGFLGAGVIMRERGSVVGLTTAAAIFAEAAIGMGAGAGFYRVSGLSALMVLFALTGLIYVEDALKLKRRSVLFRITAASAFDMVPEIHRLQDLNIKLDSSRSTLPPTNVIRFDADVTHHQPTGFSRRSLVRAFRWKCFQLKGSRNDPRCRRPKTKSAAHRFAIRALRSRIS
jgi:putative Mg2+ transporter-C (MgtC) family protein